MPSFKVHSLTALLLCTIAPTIAIPTPSNSPDEARLEERTVSAAGSSSSVLTSLQSVTATASVTGVAEASSVLSSIFAASPTPTNLFAGAAELVAAGLTHSSVDDIVEFVDGLVTGKNSDANINLKAPSKAIYPSANSSDAPYDLTEAELRAAIYIPSTFKYGVSGAPQPIILVPGTGTTGYLSFVGNYIPLLTGSTIADPVWLNIPDYLLADAQANAEFVAYAINYIYAISNSRKVAVLAWSQGNIDAQWAYKYWPSTRAKVTDHIGFSPDYHGTETASIIALLDDDLPPAILQQEYASNFIATLRADDGDSGYVPTTTIYSEYDEIVEPQQGTGASAYLLDARGVGVTNNEVQTVCANQTAGTIYTHEGILYNPLGFALLKDALAHDGPGESSRLDLTTVCSTFLTSGLTLSDLILTETTLLDFAITVLTYANPTTVEPAIKSYAA